MCVSCVYNRKEKDGVDSGVLLQTYPLCYSHSSLPTLSELLPTLKLVIIDFQSYKGTL